jgi:hypothetical protein
MSWKNNEEVSKLEESLLKQTREELVRVDTKTSILIAGLSIIFSALLTGYINEKWEPNDIKEFYRPFLYLSFVAFFVGIIFLAKTFFPKTSHGVLEDANLVSYYGNITGLTEEQLKKKLKWTADNNAANINQLMIISSMVKSKYKNLKIGVIFITTGICLFSLTTILSLL